jgi:hypothetical protein
MRRTTAAMIPLLVLLAPGCSGRRGGYDGPPMEQPPLTAAALQEKLAEWKGRVVVVDFWAFF